MRCHSLHTGLILSFFLLLALLGYSQESGNPFELSPRLAAPPVKDTAVVADTGNPFDLVAPSTVAGKEAPERPAPPKKSEKASEQTAPLANELALSSYKRFLLITNMGALLLLAVLLTLFRAQLGRAYRAFTNDKLLNQLQREREVGAGLPYYLYYGFFMINAGFFIYLISRYYGVSVAEGPWRSLLYCIAGISGLFIAKHLLLGIIAAIFPVQKEASLYNFTIVIFGIILGIVLLVANLLLSYVPEEYSWHLLMGTLGIIALVYLFRYLRGLFIAERFLLFHKFHFLLYICTVEIAPAVVLARLIIG